uniref:tripeptidyl-peptidase II n=1 Tax=Tetranychus truncatus TaxID=93132 RepID=A0A3G5APH5_9ACAR|nr:tripeptidyl-peptidase II [Tetranychus truncatus]
MHNLVNHCYKLYCLCNVRLINLSKLDLSSSVSSFTPSTFVAISQRNMSSANSVDPFPSISLLPKKETTALSFINKYPNADGKQVVIAIFDTGVDPGSAGLQVTSDGKPKIIDIISATGDHDVDTSTVVTCDEGSNIITGLTGRKLKIPSSWTNPTGKWHIGFKNGYELYAKNACSRIKAEYQRNNWNSDFSDAKTTSLRELQDFEAKEKEKKKVTVSKDTESTAASQIITGNEVQLSSDGDKIFENQLLKEDLQGKVDVLNSLEENYSDLGPTYDCVVFHDGTMWRACVDVTQTGDLEKCTVLGTYKDTLEYATLTDRDQHNYSVNIYDDGNLLEINCISGDHGTHVAAIAAANFPEEPEKNGVAPGAQLISINIGNARLGGGMETSASIIRACLRAIESKVDVINMSFGEPIQWAGGRCFDFLNEVVEKHGIIFVVADGNEGPNFSTSSASSIPDSLISIGAYVSPEMMEAEYSTREKIPGRILTFSSKDPNIEGGNSISVCAPGAAIASVSRATLAKCELFNGTSMAAPNATGCIALLLSGMKQKNLPYSPFSVRRSIENTAFKPPTYDPFSMNNGLIQIDPAFDHCAKFADSIERDVRFSVTCNGGKQGIYLRESTDTIRQSVHIVSIQPFFLNHDDYDNKIKGDFEMKLFLTCDAPWVQIPSYLLVTNCKRNITVKVDPSGLSYGSHITHLKAFDSTNPEKGFVFKIPITVIKPMTIDPTSMQSQWNQLELKPGLSNFTHITPPTGSSVVTVKVKNIGTIATGTCIASVRQLIPQGWGKNLASDFSLAPGAEASLKFPIWDHKTVDVAITKWWSSFGDALISYSIEFSGCKLNSSDVTMFASSNCHKIEIFGSSPNDRIQPKIALNHVISPLKPTEEIISPLSSRDVMPGGRQIHQLLLTYNFNLPKAAETTCVFPLTDTLLYEDEYHSHLWQIFNANKQFMMSGGPFPSRTIHKFDRYSKKLEKGDYVVKLQIRSENVALLKKINKAPIHLVTKLASSASLDIYPSYKELLLEGKQFANQSIGEKKQLNAFIRSFAADKIPKNLPSISGSYLCGSISLDKDEGKKKTQDYPFYYVLDPEAPKKAVKEAVEEKPVEEQYRDALVDFKANWIAKFHGSGYEHILSDTDNLKPDKKQALIIAQIQALDASKDENKQYSKIIELADEIIQSHNIDDFYGGLLLAKNKNKTSGDEPGKKDETLKNLEKQKEWLCEALAQKGMAILQIIRSEASSDSSATQKYTIQDLDKIVQDLKKMDELNNAKWHKFVYQHALEKHQFGRALKAVMKQQENKPSRELDDQLINCFDRLGWKFAVAHYKRSQIVAYPPSYRLF